MTEPSRDESKSPPYIPFKTLEAYLGDLKATTLPHQLDNTVRPSSMSGGTWRQLLSALQFFGLIDKDRVVQENFQRLLDAFGTDGYPKAVTEALVPSYKAIVGELPLKTATPGMLKKAFKDNANVEGQMLEKGVRFFLQTLTAAGIEHSPLFTKRQSRSGGARKAASVPRKPAPVRRSDPADDRDEGGGGAGGGGGGGERKWPAGIRPWPLYFYGKPEGVLAVPADLTEADCKVIEAQLTVLRLLAGQAAGAAGT